ncbi:MAG: TIGR02996 domain-containing protein [Myxococcaceae bacterium]|nr:TIGR02996 domain-containing protein [Myxococcaceae bacterium]
MRRQRRRRCSRALCGPDALSLTAARSTTRGVTARENLEAALDAAPHDAAAFLVYADWLLEQGDPHGELIRVEHALRLTPNDLTLKARDTLLRKQLLPGLSQAQWELGFPRHADLRWVTEEGYRPIERALKSPLCRLLEGVTLADYVTLPSVLELLSALKHLEAVTLVNSLELINSGALAKMLRPVSKLPHVRRLTLQARQVTESLDRLAGFGELARLTLSGAWLGPGDVGALRLARQKVPEGCVLALEQTSLTYAVERQLREVWPFELAAPEAPGLLVVEPDAESGRYLLEGHDLRIGSHLACDLPVAEQGLNAVHFIFDRSTLREAGDLDAPKRQLADGDRVTAGDVVLRYCSDVAAARLRRSRG